MTSADESVCLFCNGTIDPEGEACRLTIEADWADGPAGYWCHGSCLEEATHPNIPLYILGLRRDTAVYGRRVEAD